MRDDSARETAFGKLTGNTATAVFTAESATLIRSITACENTGAATPTLSVEAYDGTNSYYKCRGTALGAGLFLDYDVEFTLPQGWSIRLTSSDASGKVDWTVSYDDPSASGRLRG